MRRMMRDQLNAKVGWQQKTTCHACGSTRLVVMGTCSACGSLVAQSATQTQLIRVYKGGHLERQFQQDATRLAALGWTPGTPSYGETKGPGVGKVLAFGLLAFSGNRKPTTMTVVYTRPAPAP